MEFANTIHNLRIVISDSNCASMNKSTVVGFLGELLVRDKLLTEGLNVTHLGNQKGYDLQLTSTDPEIRIDVKTSTGNDIPEASCRTWGWALLSTSKKRRISCTHFVCVALDRDLQPFAFHVIANSNVKRFPPSNGQYKSVIHAYGAHYPRNPYSVGTKWYDQHSKSENLLEEGVVFLVKPNTSLSEALKRAV